MESENSSDPEGKSTLSFRWSAVLYPVDLPPLRPEDLNSRQQEHLRRVQENIIRLPHGETVRVSREKFAWLEFVTDADLQVLALHTPEDENTHLAAFYLHGKLWPLADVLKTSDESRQGLVTVTSLAERLVLFLLSQVVFGVFERPVDEEFYFSSYSLWEHGKIFWQNGEAVGFYTVKKKGSLCEGGGSGRSFQMPVLDTLFVRSGFRRAGLASQMLEDFCSSQPSEEMLLGISFPLSSGMFAVCRKYLQLHQRDRERLYEVEAPGDWTQRRNVWLKIQQREHASLISRPVPLISRQDLLPVSTTESERCRYTKGSARGPVTGDDLTLR